ncbi:MAG: hypothetical protein JJT78_10005 [Leptospira sp.]|nr:hypothetical protein [Leptospira sp.]
MKKLLTLLAISLLALSFGFCSSSKPKVKDVPKAEEIDPNKKPTKEDLKRLRSRDFK